MACQNIDLAWVDLVLQKDKLCRSKKPPQLSQTIINDNFGFICTMEKLLSSMKIFQFKIQKHVA